MKHRKNFKKTVWGFIEVEESSKEQALKMLAEGLENEFVNNSECEFDEWISMFSH